MNIRKVLIAFCIMALSMGAVVIAQDDSVWEGYQGEVLNNPDPDSSQVEGMVVDGDIQAVTDASDEYYGQVVSLEGVVGDFVSSRIFALGQGAAIDNRLVLVVNNSAEAFPPEIMQEARVRVTGRVHPSRIAIEEGAQTDFGALFTEQGGDVSDTAEGMAADISTEFDHFYNTWNNMGMTATDSTAADLQAFDQNLENLAEEQRLQLADALEQDANEFEANYPTLSQNLRDTAAGLRNNDVAAARTGLQTTVTELQSQQDQQAMNQANQQAQNQQQGMTSQTTRPNMVRWAQSGLIAEGFHNYTIIEVVNVENVSLVEFPQAEMGN